MHGREPRMGGEEVAGAKGGGVAVNHSLYTMTIAQANDQTGREDKSAKRSATTLTPPHTQPKTEPRDQDGHGAHAAMKSEVAIIGEVAETGEVEGGHRSDGKVAGNGQPSAAP